MDRSSRRSRRRRRRVRCLWSSFYVNLVHNFCLLGFESAPPVTFLSRHRPNAKAAFPEPPPYHALLSISRKSDVISVDAFRCHPTAQTTISSLTYLPSHTHTPTNPLTLSQSSTYCLTHSITNYLSLIKSFTQTIHSPTPTVTQ